MVNEGIRRVIHMAQESTSEQKEKFSLCHVGYHFYELL